jgi:hypothetical protein
VQVGGPRARSAASSSNKLGRFPAVRCFMLRFFGWIVLARYLLERPAEVQLSRASLCLAAHNGGRSRAGSIGISDVLARCFEHTCARSTQSLLFTLLCPLPAAAARGSLAARLWVVSLSCSISRRTRRVKSPAPSWAQASPPKRSALSSSMGLAWRDYYADEPLISVG